MASPQPLEDHVMHDPVLPAVEDAEMAVPGDDEEGEESGDNGEPTAPADDDSSEEEEDDVEEMRKIQQGFIVDEDEDEDGDESAQEERKRRRKKKRRHRHREEYDEELDEEDRELMNENLGIRPSERTFTRLRRGRVGSESESPEPTRRRAGRASEEADDNDLRRIFDDERAAADDMEVDDEDDFIDDDGEEGEGELDEEERKERRRVERERRRAFGAKPEMAGIDPAAWDEIFEVFGDGRDYEWALEGEEGAEDLDEAAKPEMKYTDVFEPSEIKARHLTEDDDIIRMTDIPERMQLSTSTLSPTATLTLHEDFDFDQFVTDAAAWVAMRISPRITRDFFRPGALHSKLLTPLILAISRALELMLVKNFEVPYIHMHWRDLISHYDPEKRIRTELLSRDELWRVGTLGMKFRALMERKQSMLKTYERMNIDDDYFEIDIKDKLDTIEAVADASEWLGMKYRQAQKDAMEMNDEDGEGADSGVKKFKKPTRTSAYELARQTITSKLADDFGIASQDIVRNFINNRKQYPTVDQAIEPLAYAEQFLTESAGPAMTADRQLELARMILATELGKDPLMRKEIRNAFEKNAVVSVLPTERGSEKIDDFHPYHNFKFLKDKPIEKMTDSPQFLYILQAESEHLVTLQIKLPESVRQQLEEQLYNAAASEATNAAGKAWNQQRKEVVKEATEKFLLPTGAKWAREWLREEVEDNLAKKCGDSLQDRVNRAPYKTPDIEQGDVPSVLALSWGKGDPQKDAIHVVVLDEEGRLRDHIKLDNLFDSELQEQFMELIKRRNPDVIVVGGFTVNTRKLMDQVKNLVNGPDDPAAKPEKNGAPNGNSSQGPSESQPKSQSNDTWASAGGGGDAWGSASGSAAAPTDGWGAAAGGDWGASSGGGNDWGAPASTSASVPATDDWGAPAAATNNAGDNWGSGPSQENRGSPSKAAPSSSPERPKSNKEKERRIPILYVNDEVARIYQHSKRAEDEYGRIPLVGRYCVGLARYLQSPLNEYAALGGDLQAITFDDAQTLVPKEKLLVALERALVNVVNTTGVDINRAAVDSYYQSLLRFISGLGPRKAQQLIQRLAGLGGTLVNRSQLIHENILPMTVFLNASGFLRVSREMSYRKSSSKKRNRNKDSTEAISDPLDDTRIHPEDYDLAKQMALDALEMDQDDVDDEAHAATFIAKLMDDPDNVKKLEVLNLDDFAATLLKEHGKHKRYTVEMIKDELLKPFGEQRREFSLPDKWDVLTMLTGETEETLQRGKIVSVSVLRIKGGFVAVRMDSGLEGLLSAQYLSNDGTAAADQVVSKGQTIPAVIIAVYVEDFRVEFSARPMDIESGDASLRRVPTDEYYDTALKLRNKDLADRKKRREVDQVRRIIKHPNFHNLNYKKAEELLATQQRGDVVIRPSTKGTDHLAVTWKVDDNLYQHIDVVDPNADATSQNVGSHLIVDGKYHFSDLDELIVNHVKAMARRVEELMAHDKFQKGSDTEIHVYLDNAVKAQRGQVRSVYAFGLNRKRPGYFNLYFKTNMNSPIQTWPVKVTPNGFQLFESEVGSVGDLCDSFKTRQVVRSPLLNATADGTIVRVMQGSIAGAAGANTPYGGGRTPAITPGRATPGHLSSRHTPGHASSRLNPAITNKTPNPYAAGANKTPNPYGGGRPVPTNASGSQGWGAPPPPPSGGGSSWRQNNPSGWASPAPPRPPAQGGGSTPAGMHPSRAALIQGNSKPSSEWSSGGRGW